MKNNKIQFLIAALLILMAAASRIINAELHIYHFAPVAALGLFSGAVLKDKRFSYLFALLSLLLSDLYFTLFTPVKGFYGIEQFFVYGAMLLVTFMGTRIGRLKPLRILGFTLAGTLLFFLISNFGVWVSIELGKTDLYGYGKGFTGLVNTYVAALPFYKSDMATSMFVNSVLGDLIFGSLLFGAYALAQKATASKLQQA